MRGFCLLGSLNKHGVIRVHTSRCVLLLLYANKCLSISVLPQLLVLPYFLFEKQKNIAVTFGLLCLDFALMICMLAPGKS
jgi:hypothetical protein